MIRLVQATWGISTPVLLYLRLTQKENNWMFVSIKQFKLLSVRNIININIKIYIKILYIFLKISFTDILTTWH